jgi:hypothetical protein
MAFYGARPQKARNELSMFEISSRIKIGCLMLLVKCVYLCVCDWLLLPASFTSVVTYVVYTLMVRAFYSIVVPCP